MPQQNDKANLTRRADAHATSSSLSKRKHCSTHGPSHRETRQQNKEKWNAKIKQPNRKTKPALTKQARTNKRSQHKTHPITPNPNLTRQIKSRRHDWIRKVAIVQNLAKESRQTKQEERCENEATQVQRICEKLSSQLTKSKDNTREQENKKDNRRQA